MTGRRILEAAAPISNSFLVPVKSIDGVFQNVVLSALDSKRLIDHSRCGLGGKQKEAGPFDYGPDAS